jgi:ribose/xylose/arabinose/galactoside ABC-type transport system permease subunit
MEDDVFMKSLFKKREFAMAVILIALMIVISIAAPAFLQLSNLINIVTNNVILAIMAIGMTLVIVTSGIDVSVGSQLGFSAVFVGLTAVKPGANIFIVLFIGVICGVLLGLINGILIAGAELPAIVVTLGTLSIFRGSILLYTNGHWVNDLPNWYTNLYKDTFLKLPIPIWILTIVVAIISLFINYTKLGRSIYAMGGNQIASSRVGINNNNINLFVFALMGGLTGIASLLYGAQLAVVDPNAGTGFEMQVIAAVVIGGANILGGSGSILGTLIGVLILGVIQNGMVLTHVQTYWQNVVMGAVIIFAVTTDVIRTKKDEQSKNVIDVEGEKA